MIENIYNNPKESKILFELHKYFIFLTHLYSSNKFPKVLLLSGQKGIGKSTLVNHLLNFIFDKDNYDFANKCIKENSFFRKQYLNNTFSNIIYLSGDNLKNVKIDDIRNLKLELYKSTISEKERFIILDGIELFNLNSLNALLKIIEEPSKKNSFILINNNTKPLIDTIKSRSLELKIRLSNDERVKIIKLLIKSFNLKVTIDYESLWITPGNFLSFNDLINENKINLDDNFIKNIEKILILYKKNKNMNLINFLLYIIDTYFMKMLENNSDNIENISEKKHFVVSIINKFVFLNMSQSSIINALDEKLSNG